MGLIERKILTTGSTSRTGTVFNSFFCLNDVNQINPISFIELRFNKNVLRQSIQLEFTADTALQEEVRFDSLNRSYDDAAIHTFNGVVFFIGQPGCLTFKLVGPTDSAVQALDTEAEAAGNDFDPTNAATSLGTQLTDLGGGFFSNPDEEGFSLFITVLRPHDIIIVNQFGVRQWRWLPYTLTITATGYELSDFSQGSGINEEQVSCLVIDENSKNLYGSRPSVREEQSDFIETQRQACRVAEAIIWNRNMVIGKNLVTLFNPSIKRGQTARVTNIGNDIDFQGIVKSVGHQFNIDNGSAITEVLIRSTEYVFQSALGENNSEEKLDRRQT